MKRHISGSIKHLLDCSKESAVVINKKFQSVWYNKEYGKKYLPFRNIDEFSVRIPEFKINNANSFIEMPSGSKIKSETSELIKTNLNNPELFLLTICNINEKSNNVFSQNQNDIYKNSFDTFGKPCILIEYPSGAVKDVNKAFTAICGIPKEHICTISVPDLFSDGECNTLNKYFSSDTLYLKSFICHITDSNDTNRFCEIHPASVDEHTIMFYIEDITEEMHNQVNVIQDSEQYAFLYKNISEGIIIWDENKIIDVNNSVCQMWGYDKKELIGKNIDFIFKCDEKSIDKYQHKEGTKISFTGIRKNRETFEGEVTKKTFYIDNKKLCITVISDLTEHKELIESEREKKSVEEHILNSQRSLIMVFDKNASLISCNEAFLGFFRCRNLNDFKQKFGSIESLFKNEYGFINSSYGKFWYKESAENKKSEYKLILHNDADDNDHIFFVSANNMAFDNSSYVVCLSDISETMETLLALKDANSQLLIKNESIKMQMESSLEILSQHAKYAMMGKMIGIITHQWKQPLNAVGLIAQNIEDIMENDEIINRNEIKEFVSSISRHVISMGETVNNFRNFFKNTNESKWFNLRKTIETIIILLQPVLKKASVETEINIPNRYGDPILSGSDNEFKQVLLNLIINAKESIETKVAEGKAKQGSGIIKINVDKPAAQKIIISVQDNGTGFSEDDLEKVFKTQYTTKGENGTGIGMFISDMVIKKMQGKIWAENWQEGAIISMELPVQDFTE